MFDFVTNHWLLTIWCLVVLGLLLAPVVASCLESMCKPLMTFLDQYKSKDNE